MFGASEVDKVEVPKETLAEPGAVRRRKSAEQSG
jgi:hypothetical protein